MYQGPDHRCGRGDVCNRISWGWGSGCKQCNGLPGADGRHTEVGPWQVLVDRSSCADKGKGEQEQLHVRARCIVPDWVPMLVSHGSTGPRTAGTLLQLEIESSLAAQECRTAAPCVSLMYRYEGYEENDQEQVPYVSTVYQYPPLLYAIRLTKCIPRPMDMTTLLMPNMSSCKLSYSGETTSNRKITSGISCCRLSFFEGGLQQTGI